MPEKVAVCVGPFDAIVTQRVPVLSEELDLRENWGLRSGRYRIIAIALREFDKVSVPSVQVERIGEIVSETSAIQLHTLYC